MSSVIFMIEGGKPLEMVRHHIAERERVRQQNVALAEELGIKEARTDLFTGVLLSVVFPGGSVPGGWTKPDSKGCSHPKKGTTWDARFKAQLGHAETAVTIAKGLNIPTSIGYGNDGSDGFRLIGTPFNTCGFLWISPEGPYAMWVPDVPAAVAKCEAEGYVVSEPEKSFKLEFEGCRRVEDEEWEILVAQYKLAQKASKVAA